VNAVVHAHPPIATGFAVAGIPLTRAVLAEVVTTLGSIPIAEYGTPSTAELPAAVRKYIKAHDGLLLANHGAVTCCRTVMTAYYKMETIEHFAKISLVARLLGREHLISREEVERLQGLRGMYGIAAPAPLCADPSELAATDQILCQVLEAPEAGSARLVPDDATSSRLLPDVATSSRLVPDVAATLRQASRDGEIRLTYGELTALIDDAVKNLRE
jgi:L-fuculose-phosphate aldolase